MIVGFVAYDYYHLTVNHVFQLLLMLVEGVRPNLIREHEG